MEKLNLKNINYIKYNLNILSNIVAKNKNILVTGGRSADYFLSKVINNKKLNNKKLNFFLSDERISSKIKNTNSFKISRFLKKNKRLKLHKIDNYPKNLIKETKKYSELFEKNKIDVAFLSLGEDYHIASLFYDCRSIYDTKYTSITYSEKFKFIRISINKNLLSKIKKIYLFINGIGKLKQFQYMLKNGILNFYFKKKTQKKIILVLRNIY